MGDFGGTNLQKSYAREKGKNYETVTIASRLFQIGRKFQAQAKTASPPGINIVLDKDPSITSGLTHDAADDGDSSLLGGASLDLDLAGDGISLLSDDAYLTIGNIYPPGDEFLGASTETGHTIS